MSSGIFGLAAAVLGGGYAAFGSDDFAVTVHRPIADTYAAFSAVHTFGSGLRDAGIDTARVQISRPSNREIVFTIPSSADLRGSRVALTLVPVDGDRATEVHAAIDVPALPYPEKGRNMVLSESRVEGKFRDAISGMAKRLDSGQSLEQAQHELTLMLDIVAIASNPAKARALEAQAHDEEQARKRYNANPGRFSDEYVLINESGGMITDVDRENRQ